MREVTRAAHGREVVKKSPKREGGRGGRSSSVIVAIREEQNWKRVEA